MLVDEIVEELNKKYVAEDDIYEFFLVESNEYYYGKKKNGNIIFMLMSNVPDMPNMNQETKCLSYSFNRKCNFVINGVVDTKTVHMLTCKVTDKDKQKAFIRLTRAFVESNFNNDQHYLLRLFSVLSSLFNRDAHVSDIELQGLYGELFTMLHLKDNGCDVASYWQTRPRMKFDFSIDETRRLEVKSTIKQERTHHFKHEQLVCDNYDIVIASVKLQENDEGESLSDIVKRVQSEYPDDFAILSHIETIISRVESWRLESKKYDRIYSKMNFRLFKAEDVPHFDVPTPDGVYRAEYDCNLDLAKELEISDFKKWIVAHK